MKRFAVLEGNETYADVTLVIHRGHEEEYGLEGDADFEIPMPSFADESHSSSNGKEKEKEKGKDKEKEKEKETDREQEEEGEIGQSAKRVYHLHRCILSARSPHFRSMFSLGLKETDQRVVHIHDINPALFAKVRKSKYFFPLLCDKYLFFMTLFVISRL